MDQKTLPEEKPNFFPQDPPTSKTILESQTSLENQPTIKSTPPPWVASSSTDSTPTSQGSQNPLPTTPSSYVKEKPGLLKKFLTFLAVVVIIGSLAYLGYTMFGSKINLPGGKKVTLKYWSLFEPTEVFQQVIADFEKQHPQIKIEYRESKLIEYSERLQNAILTGEGPDVFRIHQSWVPMLGDKLSLLPSTVYDSVTYEKTFYPSATESLKYKGQIVAVPLEFDCLSLFYNEDIFKAAGKTPPRTWDELRKVALELTVRDQQGKIRTAGVGMGATNVDHWSDILALMMLQNGADLANPTTCVQTEGLVGKTCPAADALSFFTLPTRIDRSWEETMPSSTFAFATGSLAMYFGPSWRVFDIENLKRDYQSNVNYKIIPVPQLQGGNIAWSSFWAEAVSKNSLNQAEAWELVKYLSSREVMQKLFQAQKSRRLFGEPFSRVDMAEMLKTDPLVGAFIQQAPIAHNWYLSSNTGDNGINKQMIGYYADAVNAVNKGQDPLTVLQTTSQGVVQVLRQYGLAR